MIRAGIKTENDFFSSFFNGNSTVAVIAAVGLLPDPMAAIIFSQNLSPAVSVILRQRML